MIPVLHNTKLIINTIVINCIISSITFTEFHLNMGLTDRVRSISLLSRHEWMCGFLCLNPIDLVSFKSEKVQQTWKPVQHEKTIFHILLKVTLVTLINSRSKNSRWSTSPMSFLFSLIDIYITEEITMSFFSPLTDTYPPTHLLGYW